MPNLTTSLLSEQHYIIQSSLHKKLFKAHTNDLENISKKEIEPKSGVCLINFNIHNRVKKVIIYNYVHYDSELVYSLLLYILTKNEYSYVDRPEWLHLPLLIDDSIFKVFFSALTKNDLGINRILVSPVSLKFLKFLSQSNWSQTIHLQNIVHIANHLSHINECKNLSTLLDLAFHRKYLEFFDLFFNPLNKIISSGLIQSNNSAKIHLLNNMLFIVEDKQQFINLMRDKGYNVNEGPQRLRGQINSMSNLLNTLDSDYRNALYNHYKYHYYKGNIPNILREYPLKRTHFSFQNIHHNMGNID